MTIATTARSTPVGVRLDDGFSTLIAFAADPDISLWEKTVKPPGLDGGEAVQTSTMHNVTYRTTAPRQLKTLTPCTMTVAYDPQVYDQIISLINVETTITCHFADGSTLDFYGFLQNFEPGECAEGAQPEATCTITPTNVVPGTSTEASFNYKTASGTDTVSPTP